MPFTDLLMGELLALVPTTDHWVGLMSADPLLVHDPLTVEVVGPNYARTRGMALSNGTYTNTSVLRWYGLPKGTLINALGVFDAPTNGNLLYVIRVGPHSYPNGGFYRIDAGGVVVDPTSFVYTPPPPASGNTVAGTPAVFAGYTVSGGPCDGAQPFGPNGDLNTPAGEERYTVTGVTFGITGAQTAQVSKLVYDETFSRLFWKNTDGCVIERNWFTGTGFPYGPTAIGINPPNATAILLRIVFTSSFGYSETRRVYDAGARF